jgi:hypothetical protein
MCFEVQFESRFRKAFDQTLVLLASDSDLEKGRHHEVMAAKAPAILKPPKAAINISAYNSNNPGMGCLR